MKTRAKVFILALCAVLIFGLTVLESAAITINCSGGSSFNPGVRGVNVPRGDGSRAKSLAVGYDTSLRSLPAGGLDADTYDWRNNKSGSDVGDGITTLQSLQELRDRSSWGVFTANVWGGGYKDTSTGEFVCQYIGDAAVAQLAADWVRYINRIVQIYRQGDTITNSQDLQILNSINWTDKFNNPLPKLLAPGETAVPKSVYWEIGNEPEGDYFPGYLRNHGMTKQEYSRRYRLIAAAMKAEDPTIKVGPCVLDPQYVSQIIADGGTVDFIAIHPYYTSIGNAWPGTTPNIAQLETALSGLKGWLNNYRANWISFNKPLIYSEHNPLNWPFMFMPVAQSMTHALAIAESVFTFAEQNVLAAHNWHAPAFFPVPRKMCEKLQERMGDILINSYSDGNNFRLYTTRKSGKDSVTLWGLNFSDTQDVTVNISLTGLNPNKKFRAIVKRLKSFSPDTSLASVDAFDWVEDPNHISNVSNFTVTFEDATVTVIEVNTLPEGPEPVGMKNKDLGGGDFGKQQGVWDANTGDASGTNTIGLLVKIWGKVTYIGSNFFYVDDGSGLSDGSGYPGVRVEHPYSGTLGRYVTVTGISTCKKSGSKLIRVIRPRDGNDIEDGIIPD